jgi:hypothetical protein
MIRTHEDMQRDLQKYAKAMLLLYKVEEGSKPTVKSIIASNIAYGCATKTIWSGLYNSPDLFTNLLRELQEYVDPNITPEELRSYLLWETKKSVETQNAKNP